MITDVLENMMELLILKKFSEQNKTCLQKHFPKKLLPPRKQLECVVETYIKFENLEKDYVLFCKDYDVLLEHHSFKSIQKIWYLSQPAGTEQHSQ